MGYEFRDPGSVAILREYFSEIRRIRTSSPVPDAPAADITMKENALVASVYDAAIPPGRSLGESAWWALTDFFGRLAALPVPALEPANRGDRSRLILSKL